MFEFGGCKSMKDLSGRISSYNTGRTEGDLLYYTKIYSCTDYHIVEELVHRILAKFKDKMNSRKEMLRLRYNRVVEVIDMSIDDHDRHIDYINDRCQAFLQDSIHLELIKLKDHLELNFISFGKKVKTQKMDITSWTAEKIDAEFVRFINLAAQTVHCAYDFTLHKNSVSLKLDWKFISNIIKESYKDSGMTDWRNAAKQWYGRHYPTIQIKGVKLA